MVMKLSLYWCFGTNARSIFQFAQIRPNCYKCSSLMLHRKNKQTCYCISGRVDSVLFALYGIYLLLEFERRTLLGIWSLFQNANKQQEVVFHFEMEHSLWHAP